MIRRNTWIVLGLFAVLLGATFYLQRGGDQAVEEEGLLQPTMPPTLLNATIYEIEALWLEDAAGQRASFAQVEPGMWVMLEPWAAVPEQIDHLMLETAISQLLAWREFSPIDPIYDLEVVGLFRPSYRVGLDLVGGLSMRIDIGDQTVTGSGYYLRRQDGLPQVVSTYSVDVVLDLLRQPPALPPAEPTPGP